MPGAPSLDGLLTAQPGAASSPSGSLEPILTACTRLTQTHFYGSTFSLQNGMDSAVGAVLCMEVVSRRRLRGASSFNGHGHYYEHQYGKRMPFIRLDSFHQLNGHRLAYGGWMP